MGGVGGGVGVVVVVEGVVVLESRVGRVGDDLWGDLSFKEGLFFFEYCK